MSSFNLPVAESSQMYEGGGVSEIRADELKGNLVGIRQLISAHNVIAEENKNKVTVITALTAEVQYLKTAPFIALIATIMNLVGSVLVGIGVNYITAEKTATTSHVLVLIGGILMLITAAALSIFFPFARAWFK